MEALLIFWAVVWICKNAAEDVMGAVKGRPSPRRVRQLKRIEESGGTPGYGVGGYARDFVDDFLRERTAKRREMAEKRKAAELAEVPQAEAKQVATFTPQAEDRHVDPLGIFDDSRQPKEGEVHFEEGTRARYRYEDGVWWKTHNVDGTEIPLCPACGRYRYKAIGDGCGNCRPLMGPEHYTVCARCNYLNGPTAQAPFTCPSCGAGDEHLEPADPPAKEEQPSPSVAPVIPIFSPPASRTSEGEPMTDRWGPEGDPAIAQRRSPDGLRGQVADYVSDMHQNHPEVWGNQSGAQAAAPTAKPTATTQEGPAMTTEVTGLATAIQYAEGVAAAHVAHSTDAETFASSLAGNGVGDDTVGLVAQAQEASAAAADAWQSVADTLHGHTGVKEAYDATPDAGDKEFVTAE